MRAINLRNETFLKLLNGYSDYVMNNEELLELFHNEDNQLEKDRYKGPHMFEDEYLDVVRGYGRDHDGFPESIRGFELDHYFGKYKFSQKERDHLNALLFDMTMELSAHRNALACFYPPGGGITWHNNWNAPGYNILFTYSHTGEGYFKI